MKNYMFLDIETVPIKIEHEDIREYLMDKKITKDMRSLNPNYSKIIMICIKINDIIKTFSGEEKKLLEEFWNFLDEHKDCIFVTYNGYKFDIPFLVIRSCINNIKIPININRNRWNMEKSNHFDVMLFFSQNETFINPNLTVLANMHNIEIKGERFDGRDIERLYKNNELEKIEEHCKQDVEILEGVFKKICLGYLEN